MSKITATASKVGAKEAKKKVLGGINVKTAKVFVGTANYGDSIAEDAAIVTLGVFFDGTLNNRENTKARIAYEKANMDSYRQPSLPTPDSPTSYPFFNFRKPKTPKEDPRLAFAAERYDEIVRTLDKKYRGSYENDLSNVARMEPAYKEKNTGKQYMTKVYVEGIATDDLQSDDEKAAAYGTGPAGVLKKVEKACAKSAEEIRRILPRKVTQIKYLMIDVFGFSRGAAAARNFIHEINLYEGHDRTVFDDGDSAEKNAKKDKKYGQRFGELGEQLAAMGYDVKILIVRFAGLYDTVASYGPNHMNDTRNLKLTAVSRALHSFQLVAQDEHRENFVITNIDSAGSRGLQCMVPGVHSDIGGGYTDHYKEQDLIIQDTDHSSAGRHLARRLRDHLIEFSWYKPSEITINNDNAVLINRTVASNAYSFIPLHIMAEYAITKKMPYNLKMITQDYPLDECSSVLHPEDDSITLQADLKSIKARLDSHVYHGAPPMLFTNDNDREMLRVIRTNYMHTSAHYNDKIKYVYAPHYPDSDYIKRHRDENEG